MIRIAFLGSDSTHTEAFAKLTNTAGAPFAHIAQVCSIWGLDDAQTRSKAAANGIGRVAKTAEEALDGADLAMVIGRFADSHFDPAMMALKCGVPTFVDKPFTDNSTRARALIGFARDRGVALCSSSPLRFAKELAGMRKAGSAPATFLSFAPATCTDLGPDPRLNSAFFYGIHALEILLEVVGHEIETKCISYGRRFISVMLDVVGGDSAQLLLVRDTPEFYSIGRIDRAGQTSATIELDGSYYHDELHHILHEFLPGKRCISLVSTLAAINLLEKIDRDDPFRT